MTKRIDDVMIFYPYLRWCASDIMTTSQIAITAVKLCFKEFC